MQNILATLATFAVALAWLRLNNFAAARGWVSSDLSRKLIHIGTGPLFVLCWLIYQNTPEARFLAALVPLAITGQFVLVGTGVIKDPAAVKSMSRSGDRREILRGPLYYGIIFVVLTLAYWYDSPVGMVALMLMCGGDGLADIIGRRLGKHPLPWAQRKTWEGSLAMFAGGLVFSAAILAIFTALGHFSGNFRDYLPGLLAISVAGTLVESLPTKDIDNLTITAVAILLGELLW